MRGRRLLAVALAGLMMTGGPAASRVQARQTLNVQGADIRAFIQDMARATGRTFIVDPAVTGTVSASVDRPMGRQELFEVFLSTLRANGLVVAPTASGAYRISPAETAAQGPATAGAERFATEVLPLRYIDAASAVATLQPLVGPQGRILPNPSGASLVVADFADNLARIRALLARIDVDRSTLDVITLENSSAREIAAAVAQILAPPGGQPGQGAVSVTAIESSNSLVLRGDAAAVARYGGLVRDLDGRARAADDIRVVFLQHADAEQLVPVLQQLVGQAATPAALAARSGEAAASEPVVSAPTPGQRAGIARFAGANALIISASPDMQRTLAEVIRQLDVRRQQVLIEAIVVELSDTAVNQLGVQWLLADNDGRTLAATNLSASGTPLLPLAGAAAAAGLDKSDPLRQQLSQAAANSLLGANGFLGGALQELGDDGLLGFVINAAKSDAGSNLLQTPSLMTLDNQEATILVGQEVPITTGETVLNGNTNPFRTTERQNIGVKLTVRPKINAGGSITLTLRQEVSSVNRSLTAVSSDLVLNKRELETTLVLDDGDVAVAGGLLEQTDSVAVDDVPGLSTLPVVGGLFRARGVTRGRTNLMVFIRPTIVRSPSEAREVAADRWSYMRARQTEALNGQEPSLDALLRDYMRADGIAATVEPRPGDQIIAPAGPIETAPLPPAGGATP